MISLKYFFLTFFIISIKAIACSCESTNVETSYLKSDFVAKIIITSIYPNKENYQYYKADILIDKLYKGQKMASVFIDGNNGRSFETSCDIFIKKGEELIVYLIKNKNGEYIINQCSRRVNIRKEFYKTELKVLQVLKDKNYFLTSNVEYKTGLSESLYFLNKSNKNKKRIKCKNSFAIYELSFDTKNNVKCVRKIKSFKTKVDARLKKIFKERKWSRISFNKKDINNKTLVIIYCSIDKEQKQSFYSQNY